MIDRYGLLALGIVSVVLLIPVAAQACPVCFASADDRVIFAFYATTLFLTVMPFAIVGSILGWLFYLKRQARGLCRTVGAVTLVSY